MGEGDWNIIRSEPGVADVQISALPTVVGFRDGKVKNKFGTFASLTRARPTCADMPVGFKGEADIKKFLGLL